MTLWMVSLAGAEPPPPPARPSLMPLSLMLMTPVVPLTMPIVPLPLLPPPTTAPGPATEAYTVAFSVAFSKMELTAFQTIQTMWKGERGGGGGKWGAYSAVCPMQHTYQGLHAHVSPLTLIPDTAADAPFYGVSLLRLDTIRRYTVHTCC